jgi:hypothetical protein
LLNKAGEVANVLVAKAQLFALRVRDIYLHGFLFLAVVLDAWSRRIVGLFRTI